MANFSIGNGQTSSGPYTLTGGDAGIIASGGTLAPSSSVPGVTFSYSLPSVSATVDNSGTIDAEYGDAIYGASANLTNNSTVSIINEATGQILSAGIALDFPKTTGSSSATISILNSGTISGSFGAVLIAGVAVSNLVNSGVVTGSVSLGATSNTLTSFGALTGNVTLSGSTDTLTNSGTISGNVTYANGVDTLYNYGTITGNVTFSGSASGSDSVTNYGYVTGNIDFGGSSDTLTLGTGSKVVGSIDGGGGQNLLVLTGPGAGTVGNFTNFETVDLNSGSWTLQSETMQDVVFNGAKTVTLGNHTLTDGSFAAQINNFGVGDSIVLQKVSGLTTATLGHKNVLTLTGSGGSITLNLDPSYDYTGLTFKLTTDSSGDTIVEVICFYPGTMIATPKGHVAVETLGAGDVVTTVDGREAVIRWMGRQTVSTRFGDPLRVLPVRICAGALGDNLPVRDLLVSPDHALLIDGVLVHAGALVNDVNIFRESDVPETFTYWHIETADHSLVLAEGVAAETFVDNVERLAFDNWAEHVEAEIPAPIAEMAYPRVKSARQLPQAIRRRLAETHGGARVRAA